MHIINHPVQSGKTEGEVAKMKKAAALIGIFMLSFGVSILMCTILPASVIVFIEAAMLIAAGILYVFCVL